jgi:hypothetical protein
VPHRDSVSTRDRSRYILAGREARDGLGWAGRGHAATSLILRDADAFVSHQVKTCGRSIRPFSDFRVFLLWPNSLLPVCQVAVAFAEPVSPAAVEALLFALPHLAQEVPLQITVRHWGAWASFCIHHNVLFMFMWISFAHVF